VRKCWRRYAAGRHSAAAGIIDLEKMTLRLGEDQRRAAELGDLLAKVDGLRVKRKRAPPIWYCDTWMSRFKERQVKSPDG
jgi:hypothetical protein